MKKYSFIILLLILNTGYCYDSTETEGNVEIAEVFNYDWPDTTPQSQYYSTTVYYGLHREDVFTYVSIPRLTEGPDGIGVNYHLHDRTLSFAEFSFSGTIVVEVTKLFGTKAHTVEISPKAYGIDPIYFDGRTVRFVLDRWRYVSVNFKTDDNRDSDGSGGFDIKHGMMIFADPPEKDVPSLSDPGVIEYGRQGWNNAEVIYFAPGKDYNLNGHLRLRRDNQHVYISGGALVRGGIDPRELGNIKIHGRGIITMKDYPWHVPESPRMIELEGVSNGIVEGIIMTQSTTHTIPEGDGCKLQNIKIIGWSFNNDGIRPNDFCIVDGIFIKTMDDYDYAINDYTVRNSLFWPMRNGSINQLGWGTSKKHCEGGKLFSNNCVINSEWNGIARNRGVVASKLAQGTTLEGFTLENLFCENNTSPVVNITLEYDSSLSWDPDKPGYIGNFLYKNVKLENPFFSTNEETEKQLIHGFEKEGVIGYVHDIRFVNLIAGNTLITEENYLDYFDIDPITTYNISFETEGELHSVSTSTNGNGQIIPPDIIPVPDGTDQAVSIVPDDGYGIHKVIVDGVDVGRKQVHVFRDVTEDHSIYAEFVEDDNYFEHECHVAWPVQAWYPFEGNIDDSYGRFNGTIYDVSFVDGITNSQAAHFDGIDDYITIPDSINNSFSFSFWIRAAQQDSLFDINNEFGIIDGGIAESNRYLEVSLVDGHIAFTAGGPEDTLTSGTQLTDGLWHHILATCSASDCLIELYVDSNQEAVKTITPPLSDHSSSFHIGCYANETGYFYGDIDDLRLFNMPFEATAINHLIDKSPPLPNPAEFERPPAPLSGASIAMEALTGTDETGVIEYYFEELTGNEGGSDSGWQKEPYYKDTGLKSHTSYTYTVTTRDSFLNLTLASAPLTTTTGDYLSTPWETEYIGHSNELNGKVYSEEETFFISSGGPDILEDRDSFVFVYQPIVRDCTIIAHVADLTDEYDDDNRSIISGIMIRKSLHPKSEYAMVAVTANNNNIVSVRKSRPGYAIFTVSESPVSNWLKLTRQGNRFSTYLSTDGQSWEQVGEPETVSMKSEASVGLFVKSCSETILVDAIIDNVQITQDTSQN